MENAVQATQRAAGYSGEEEGASRGARSGERSPPHLFLVGIHHKLRHGLSPLQQLLLISLELQLCRGETSRPLSTSCSPSGRCSPRPDPAPDPLAR
eukprot:scaffold787_cov240-Pinguiococcus_pyrenoidosus.AAC.1